MKKKVLETQSYGADSNQMWQLELEYLVFELS